jgi:glutamate carboxypeptidase
MLKQHVEHESPSTDKVAVDRYGALLAAELQNLGAQIETQPQTEVGNHLVARWGTGKGGLLIMCHIDTVHAIGELKKNPVREEGVRFFGPGTQDMKASIVQTLTAIRALREHKALPARPLTFLLSTDEEIGSGTSRALIESLAKESSLVLCMEPAIPDGSLKTARKGIGNFDITIQGRSTHAGADHEGGVNAIEEMARQVLDLQRLTDYAKGTTVNVGVINGGTRSNVVPDECKIEIDLRVVTPSDAAEVCATINALRPYNAKTKITVSGGMNRPPMPRTEIIAKAFKQAQSIAASMNIKIDEGSTGGGSDANFVAPLGVPVLDGLGPVGSGAHSEREHILIQSLPERTALLAAILSEWQ